MRAFTISSGQWLDSRKKLKKGGNTALLRTTKEQAAIEAEGGVSYGPSLAEEDQIEQLG